MGYPRRQGGPLHRCVVPTDSCSSAQHGINHPIPAATRRVILTLARSLAT